MNRNLRALPSIVAAVSMISLCSAARAELLVNPGFEDLDSMNGPGDGWGSFGAAGFHEFFGPNGHASLFMDNPGNFGGVFQTGIAADPALTYTFSLLDVRIEQNAAANARFGLEYYAGDDATKLGEDIVAIPMFPHYSYATTHAAYSFMFTAMEELGIAKMPVHWVPAYYDHPLYLDALAATIRAGVEATPGEGPTHLLFTPHGLPLSFVRRGDPYPEQIRETARQVIRKMGWQDGWSLGWQSRVGPVQWLGPGTPDVMASLVKEGIERVTLVPISFVSDHVETLHEIDIEYAEEAHEMGLKHFGRAPALNLEPAFIACLADLVHRGLAQFERYHCVRCLHLKPDAHRRQSRCANCRFDFPNFLQRGQQRLS